MRKYFNDPNFRLKFSFLQSKLNKINCRKMFQILKKLSNFWQINSEPQHELFPNILLQLRAISNRNHFKSLFQI